MDNEPMKAHWPISILSTLSSLISMALPLILVRSLDQTTLGFFKVFFLYLMVCPPLTFIAGVSNGLSYWAGHGSMGKKALRNSAILFLVISSLSLVFLLAFKMPIARNLKIDAEWISLFAYALFFNIAAMFYDEAAIATGRIWTGAIFNSGFDLIRTAAIVVIAISTHDLFSIIKVHIFVQMLKVIAGYVLAYRQDLFRFEWDGETFKSVARYAFPVSLAFLFGLWLNYSDQIILSKTISAAEFALYSVCCLTVPPLMILEASVTRVLIPQLSETFATGKIEQGVLLFRKAVKELSFLVIPSVIGLIIFANPIIELLFTKTYLSGAPYLRLYSLWYLTLIIPPDAIARARGQAKWILGNFISFACITLALCFALGHYGGAIGVLGGLLIARFLSRAYTVFYMKKSLGWSIRSFIPFQAILKMFGICIALGVACMFLKPFFNSSISWFLVAGGLFAFCYLALGFPLLAEQKTSPQKVLMLTPGLFIGGLEKMILNLSKSLKRSSRWQPQVLAYDFAAAPPGRDLVPSFLHLNIPVSSQSKPPRFSFRTATQIVGTISRDGVSVIHTHDLGALIYGAIAKTILFTRVKLVHTQHSFVHLNRSWKYRYYERFFTLFANSIAVVSEDTGNSYLKLGVSKNKLHLIPNGVDFPDLPNLDRSERIAVRGELLETLPKNLTPDINRVWILYLARIHGRKGQDHAIQVWNELPDPIRQKCSLLLVGPETETGELKRIETLIQNSKDRDQIILAGPSLESALWLKACDLYYSASEFEGMPLSPVEAIGSGIPSLLSDIPGHDFLKSFSESYSLSDPKSGALKLEKLVQAVLTNDLELRILSWARSAPLRESFTLSTMSDHYEKLYGLKS